MRKDKAFSVGVLKKYFKSDDDQAMPATYDFYVGEVIAYSRSRNPSSSPTPSRSSAQRVRRCAAATHALSSTLRSSRRQSTADWPSPDPVDCTGHLSRIRRPISGERLSAADAGVRGPANRRSASCLNGADGTSRAPRPRATPGRCAPPLATPSERLKRSRGTPRAARVGRRARASPAWTAGLLTKRPVQSTSPQSRRSSRTSSVVRTRAMRGKTRRMKWSWLSSSGEVQASRTMMRL